jgi:hypothetical protein
MVIITITSKGPPTDQSDGLSETAQEQTFLIHKDFICHYSEFFAAAFNEQFKEEQMQAMTLGDIDPAAFALLVALSRTFHAELGNVQNPFNFVQLKCHEPGRGTA